MPVLRRAMQSRAAHIEEANSTLTSVRGVTSLRSGPLSPGSVLPPLRIFIIDAGEFPFMARRFRVEAFPTTVFFGRPGVTPIMAQGYLSDLQLSEVLQQIANA